MPFTIKHQPESNQVVASLSGKLTKVDYEQAVPELEHLIRTHDKLNLLVHMVDFHGWNPAALWEDIKFDAKHRNDVERLAFVGDRKWEEWMAKICYPFTSAEIRYFDAEERDAAEAWIREHALAPSDS